MTVVDDECDFLVLCLCTWCAWVLYHVWSASLCCMWCQSNTNCYRVEWGKECILMFSFFSAEFCLFNIGLTWLCRLMVLHHLLQPSCQGLIKFTHFDGFVCSNLQSVKEMLVHNNIIHVVSWISWPSTREVKCFWQTT